jgi:hypothetical protein
VITAPAPHRTRLREPRAPNERRSTHRQNRLPSTQLEAQHGGPGPAHPRDRPSSTQLGAQPGLAPSHLATGLRQLSFELNLARPRASQELAPADPLRAQPGPVPRTLRPALLNSAGSSILPGPAHPATGPPQLSWSSILPGPRAPCSRPSSIRLGVQPGLSGSSEPAFVNAAWSSTRPGPGIPAAGLHQRSSEFNPAQCILGTGSRQRSLEPNPPRTRAFPPPAFVNASSEFNPCQRILGTDPSTQLGVQPGPSASPEPALAGPAPSSTRPDTAHPQTSPLRPSPEHNSALAHPGPTPERTTQPASRSRGQLNHPPAPADQPCPPR